MPISPTLKCTLLAGGAVLTLLTTGCGSHATPGTASGAGATTGGATTGAAGGAAAGKKTCAAAPASMITATLGVAVANPDETDNGSVTMCSYGGGTTIVRFDTATNATSFAVEKQGFATQGMTTTDISGFGDEAYSSILSAGGITTNTVVVRKGSIEVLISSKATIEQEKSLAEKLLAVL